MAKSEKELRKELKESELKEVSGAGRWSQEHASSFNPSTAQVTGGIKLQNLDSGVQGTTKGISLEDQ